MTSSERPRLPQEDAGLWARVTHSLTPLKGPRDRLHFGPLLDEKPAQRARSPRVPPAAPTAKVSQNGTAPTARVSARGTLNAPPLASQQIRLPQQNSFSRREMRQINNGHQSIEARLDLHGMRQANAHMALVNFLANAQTRGFRHVLVITGKGRAPGGDEMMFGEQEQGVLRRMVPVWLGEPECRLIVSGFSDAPRRHGGEGALYVRLRRAR